MKLWFLEGVDKVGKSTLLRALDKTFNHRWHIKDRGFVSYEVYKILEDNGNNKWQKELHENFIMEMELANAGRLGYIYVKSSVADIQNRMQKFGEKTIAEDVIVAHMRAFETSLLVRAKAKIPIIEIDTTAFNNQIFQCSLALKTQIEKYENF